ncbi:unnamed protein product [Ambrosiozyma monospora]|uniref:Unnamed protein product n=1 Tax=Ambrosiozyma monospora TaxID=43982 RepID=A0ACB5TC30_AMBMO|nr:unnamed protein product [Ambrosiozyma monospora]
MSLTFQLATAISKLPLKIQYVILSDVMLRYFTDVRKYSDNASEQIDTNSSRNNFEKPLSHFTYLIGHYTLLDDVLSIIAEILWFDERIFDSHQIHVQAFTMFVLSRSLKIHFTTSDTNTEYHNNPDSMKLLEFGCRDLDINACSFSRISDINESFLKLVTSLTCNLNQLKDLMRMDVLKSSRLDKLNIAFSILCDGMMDDVGFMGTSIPTIGELTDAVETLIASWVRSERLKSTELKKKQLVVTINLDEEVTDEPIALIDDLADLNENNDFELRLDTQSESYLPLDVISRFIDVGLINPMFLNIPPEVEDFETSLELLNETPNLRTLYLQSRDYNTHEGDIPQDINIDNSDLEFISIDIDWEEYTPFDLNLDTHSLKELHLTGCTINNHILNSFPDSLNKLTFTNVRLNNFNICVMRLPIHLCSLFIDAGSGATDFTTFEISNATQLSEFTDLVLILHNSRCSNTELRRFVQSFPQSRFVFSR